MILGKHFTTNKQPSSLHSTRKLILNTLRCSTNLATVRTSQTQNLSQNPHQLQNLSSRRLRPFLTKHCNLSWEQCIIRRSTCLGARVYWPRVNLYGGNRITRP